MQNWACRYIKPGFSKSKHILSNLRGGVTQIISEFLILRQLFRVYMRNWPVYGIFDENFDRTEAKTVLHGNEMNQDEVKLHF